MKTIWPTVRLKDATSFLRDGTHFSPASKDGPFRYVTSKNIRAGRMSLSDSSFISVDDHRRIFSGCPVQFGDVLLTKDGASVGNACLNELTEEISLLSSVAAIRGKAEVLDNNYLLQYFLSPLGQTAITAEVGGQAITRVTLTAIGQFQIPLPPLSEQRQIAAVLSTWDRAIELTEKLIAANRQRKAALMQQLLTGKVRLPGFTGEWRHEQIGQYLEECSSRVPSTTALPIYTSSRSGLKPQEEYYAGRTVTNDGEYGVVPINCFVFRHMSDDGLFVFHINQTGGDIAVSKEYPVFRAINLDRHFLLAKLNHTPDFRAFAVSQKAGGTRTRLYFSKLRLWKTVLPSLPEQQAIAAVLNTADEEIALLTRKLDALRRQKKGLMQQLLTGKVRVRVDGPPEE